jgi:uncharacterized protein GlcG (DUF336 family)
MTEFVKVTGNISAAAAAELVETAAAAQKEGVPSSIAIVDSGGNLTAFRRMDGATPLAVAVSQDKAYSAAIAGRPTHAWQEIFAKEQPLASGIPSGVHRIIVFGGGYPTVVNGSLIGGIRVSGGHYSQDMRVAQAALSWLEDSVVNDAS